MSGVVGMLKFRFFLSYKKQMERLVVGDI